MPFVMDGDAVKIDPETKLPVFRKDDGTEEPFDPDRALADHRKLSGDVETLRKRLSTAPKAERVAELEAKIAELEEKGSGKTGAEAEELKKLRGQVESLTQETAAEKERRKAADARAMRALAEREFGRAKHFAGRAGSKPLTTLVPKIAADYLLNAGAFKANDAGDGLVAVALDPETGQPSKTGEPLKIDGEVPSLDDAIAYLGPKLFSWWGDVQTPSGAQGSEQEPGSDHLPPGKGPISMEQAEKLSAEEYAKARSEGRFGRPYQP